MVQNTLYFEQVKALLLQAKIVKIPVAGISMRPSLYDGDVVTLSRPCSGDISWGKIVLVYCNDRYILHRVVHISNEFIDLAGDNNLVQVEHVSKNDVIAVVLEAYRNQRPLHIYNKARILNAWLRHQIRPLRYLFKKILTR